jgi:hypothetical protein
VVSECCPVGCGFDVVLLRSVTDASIFCYCSTCGCAWRSPSDAQFSSGLRSIDAIETFAPGGVDVPTLAQIENAGLAGEVMSNLWLHEWDEKLDELNERISEGRPTQGGR